MIRINLLPQKRKAGSQSDSQLWLGIVLGLVVLEVIAAFLLYSSKQEELSDWRRKNARVQDQIGQSKKKVKDHKDIKARLERLREREEAIAKLQSARTGPTAVMLEIARLLTKGRGPSIDPEKLSQIERDNPLAMYNPQWDSKRIWILSFTEHQRTVRLTGKAKDGEDVSELARRMNLSSYFYDVKLLPASREGTARTDWVNFKLEARARY